LTVTFGRLPGTRRIALYSSAVISGFATMALEMLIGRTLTPYFGGTIYTWGALISVFLAGMSTGYALAGRVADRRPNLGVIAALFLFMGLYMVVPSLLGDAILNGILDQTDDVRIGALSAALALAFAPAALMAGVSPFCMRLLLDDAVNSGKVSGRISALVTVGSIGGALVTSFFLIPTMGVRSIYAGLGLLVGLAALVFGALAMVETRRRPDRGPASIVVVGVCSLAIGLSLHAGKASAADVTVEKVDSQYNTILIDRDGPLLSMNFGYRNLRYEESAMNVSRPDDLIIAYTRAMTAAVAYPTAPIRNIALVGLGGGRTIVYLTKSMPGVRMDVAELDPKVIDLAAKYFGVRSTGGAHIVNADGRVFLRGTPIHYDIVMLDAYRGPFVPFHLTTKEFYQQVKRKLVPGGVVVQNIDPSTLFFDSSLVTMKSVFANVDVYQAEGNVVLIGYDGPRLSDSELARRAGQRQAQFKFRYDLPTLVRGRDSNPAISGKGKVLTDDFAPVELLTTIKRNNVKRQ
jgi:spermidine synthase